MAQDLWLADYHSRHRERLARLQKTANEIETFQPQRFDEDVNRSATSEPNIPCGFIGNAEMQ
jgi:iron-sulfur cluster repair protein YtfE (RIC family)